MISNHTFRTFRTLMVLTNIHTISNAFQGQYAALLDRTILVVRAQVSGGGQCTALFKIIWISGEMFVRTETFRFFVYAPTEAVRSALRVLTDVYTNFGTGKVGLADALLVAVAFRLTVDHEWWWTFR